MVTHAYLLHRRILRNTRVAQFNLGSVQDHTQISCPLIMIRYLHLVKQNLLTIVRRDCSKLVVLFPA